MKIGVAIVAVLLLVVSKLQGSYAVFSPNVTILSCLQQAVVVRLKDAADGGLVYIQGSGPDCSRTTEAGPSDYTFRFDTCGLEYDRKFRVVVQQRPHLQTGDDKVIPVMCLVDTRELVVTGVVYPEDTSDTAVNKTVRPTVRMAMQTETGNENLREVTLNDNVKMIVRLDDEYLDDFDIKAKDCTAAFIPVVSNECSSDEELFPNFVKSTQGILTTSFQAFQPTILEDSDDVDVAFTCSVTVCKGTCEKTICGEIVGWGRRKKRNDDTDDVIERVTIGTKLRVKSPHAHNTQVATLTSQYCAERTVVATVSSLTLIVLFISWLLCGCILTKLIRLEKKNREKPKKGGKLRRLSEMNANFARSVGRRLSSMFNLPFGYDMRDPRMMDQIPDTYPEPPMKRRESVTVSTVSSNEHTDTDDISVTSSCACVLRKRLVSSGSQTDSERGSEDADAMLHARAKAAARSSSPVPFEHNNNNPITSLSIQSFSRSFDATANKEKADTRNNIESPSSSFESSRVYYTADEIPTNREHALKTQSIVTTDNSLVTAHDRTTRSNVTVIDIVKPKALSCTANTRTSDETPMEKLVPIDVDDEYASIDCMQDVFEHSSEFVPGTGSERSSTENTTRESNNGGRGSATFVLNSIISSSKKKLNRFADVLVPFPNKEKFDLNSGTDAIRNSSALSGRSAGKCRGDPNSSDSTNRPVGISIKREPCENTALEAEGVEKKDDTAGNAIDRSYEPICFDELGQPQRKLSTHV